VSRDGTDGPCAKSLSPVELTRQGLTRNKAIDPTINAFILTHHALQRVRRIAARAPGAGRLHQRTGRGAGAASGAWKSPLFGPQGFTNPANLLGDPAISPGQDGLAAQ
jgi:Asp-tRNA(Asn)/Glu-tRNA(Gln) amidotransferase A subunit family amidase